MRSGFSLVVVAAILSSSLSLTLSPAGPAPSAVSDPEVSSYSPHGPIRIEGNGGFAAASGVVGGSGTPSEPYVIEGWEIAKYVLRPWNRYGIEIRNTSAHFVIRDVWIHSFRGYGDGYGWADSAIYLDNVTNGRISNALIEESRHGILLVSSRDVVIEDSTISEASDFGYGIVFSGSTRILIDNNTISLQAMGIALSSWGDVRVSRNTISNNWHGIDIHGVDEADQMTWVVVEGNAIRENVFGIIVHVATIGGTPVSFPVNVLVHHNNFIHNQLQTLTGGPIASWDSGYPSGGNYWSDHMGMDRCSGPTQDVCIDPDGIVDTPYQFRDPQGRASADLDRCPLASPWIPAAIVEETGQVPGTLIAALPRSTVWVALWAHMISIVVVVSCLARLVHTGAREAP